MAMNPTLARIAEILGVVSISLVSFSSQGLAAIYEKNAWFLSGSYTLQIVNPDRLNDETAIATDSNPIPYIHSWSLTGERGLFEPSATHWAEVSYRSGSIEAAGSNSVAYSQSASYFAFIPIGLSWWFMRSAYTDFGLGAGGGFGFLPKFSASLTPTGGQTSLTNFEGSWALLFDGRFTMRLWLGGHIGMSLTGLVQYFQVKASPVERTAKALNIDLFAAGGMLGVSYAFGGIKGTGRSFVEVLPERPENTKK